MKIVHVVYNLQIGGAEVVVAQLCRLQRAQGHDVQIFAYDGMSTIGESLKAEGFNIYVPGKAHPLKTMWRYFRSFREIKPDVVHCHNLAPTIQASVSARMAGVSRVLSTRHGFQASQSSWEQEAKYNLASWFCHWVTGICEVTCEDMRRGPFAHKSRIVCVYNGAMPIERSNFESLGKAGLTLLFVGRLAPVKALGTLIRAVSTARQEIPGLSLWIVGDGDRRNEWEVLVDDLGVRDAVTFWGQRTDTAHFYSAADIFVMSSVSEGLPMSLLESMSLGIPAVVTDVGGMGEVVRLTRGGLLVPVNDPESTAAAIVRLARDSELYADLSENALAAYSAHFTLEHMAAGYMKLYQKEPVV